MSKPLVGVVMGSKSDWDTMSHTVSTLEDLGIPCEARVLSAHRTPDAAAEYSATAESRGLEVIIAAAGGAAHLAGVMAAKTILPVLGVPMKGWSLDGLDALLSTVQMPRGVPVGTLAIGKAGAVNAALLAAEILGGAHPEIRRTHDAHQCSDDQYVHRVQDARESEGHQRDCQCRIDGPHDTEQVAVADPVAHDAEDRRKQGADILQRGIHGEHQHRSGFDQHVPAEDQRLHLERPRSREISGPLEPEAADAERREHRESRGRAQDAAPYCIARPSISCGPALPLIGKK